MSCYDSCSYLPKLYLWYEDTPHPILGLGYDHDDFEWESAGFVGISGHFACTPCMSSGGPDDF